MSESGGDFVVVNDDVMGGRSRSMVVRDPSGVYRFSGWVSLENRGGFASCRSVYRLTVPSLGQPWLVRVLPDSREYSVNLYPMGAPVAFSYRARVVAAPGVWTTLALTETDFTPTQFGRVVGPSRGGIFGSIQSWGIMIADKRQGAFSIDFQRVETGP